MSETVSDEIAAGLAPLFEKAREKGLWFCQPYYGLVLSPNELESHQAAGRYRFGACNWKLIDPRKELRSLEDAVDAAMGAVVEFKLRMEKGGIHV